MRKNCIVLCIHKNNKLQSLYKNPTVARETTPIDIAVQASKIFNDEKSLKPLLKVRRKVTQR